jgi:hypothetical protein
VTMLTLVRKGAAPVSVRGFIALGHNGFTWSTTLIPRRSSDLRVHRRVAPYGVCATGFRAVHAAVSLIGLGLVDMLDLADAVDDALG